MSLANHSVAITAGSGTTVATMTDAASKELQVIVPAGPTGHVKRSTPTYIIATGNQANVAAARTTHVDIFNAASSGKILKIYGIFIIPTLAAVTGVGLTWEIIPTSAVGTGGTGLTALKFDSTNGAVPAQVTARAKPTGGATGSTVFQFANTSSEETIPYGSSASILNHVLTFSIDDLQPIVLREGEGLKIDQTTSSNVGSTNIQIIFTLE
jgi:hypothetical protein